MDEIKDFNIIPKKRELITIVGAGGKTRTMFNLAKKLKELKMTVLVTTTTAIFYPDKHQYDKIIINSMGEYNEFSLEKDPGVYVLGSSINEEGKLIGISKELVNKIYKERIFDYILVEGDGSKRKPIKAPADHEPVIPELSTKVIGVIGMDALGKEINEENVHRPGLFCKITNSIIGDIIDAHKLILLIKNENGLFKATPPGAEKYIKLNKVKGDKDKEVIKLIKSKVTSLDSDTIKVVTEKFQLT